MNESILRALMRLFAIIADVKHSGVSVAARGIVESYLKQQLSKEQVAEYIRLFDEYVESHRGGNENEGAKARKRTSANSVKVIMICNEINEVLQQKEKVIVLLRLLDFLHEDKEATEKEMEFIETVADIFNVSKAEFNNLKAFVLDTAENIPEHSQTLIIDGLENVEPSEIKHIYRRNLSGRIVVLQVNSTNTYVFRYLGEEPLFLNGQAILRDHSYVFDSGASIRNPKISPIYHNDVVGQFIQAATQSRITFTAQDIEFYFTGSKNGIQKFTFSEESGRMIGIMGGSGVGKSTLLSVFNGTFKPHAGKITINGLDLHADKKKLEGVIGYVPQDDLLLEELTVFQNLYYNAKLCFGDMEEHQIIRMVTKTLVDLDLNGIKHLTVGSPLNKTISGGQRKRLNVALELIREPSILIVDEPTSGLSSADSEMVMTLLKEQTLKGKLVIVNIHQPSSDIYKLFDKVLVMDKGGHPTYYGNPIDAVIYFKETAHYVNAQESECPTCGNVNPEQVLQILEAKVVNEYGQFTRNRKFEPRDWYDMYITNVHPAIEVKQASDPLPKNFFKRPNWFRQMQIFGIRNLLSKLTNTQYMVINLLEAPLLAVVLGFFTKYIAGTPDDPNAYIFSLNENLPAYLFMCVIVSLFLGLTVSAEEIIRDRKILQREAFLNLSRFSYLNSKIMFLFILSAVQALSYVLIGNWILGINGMTFSYWAILFSVSASANMIGLNISSALNSVVTIYILIPFLLVPQLSLSGVIVNFDKLHKTFTHPYYVPLIGDVMTARWGYEALAVEQFKQNEFDRNFYDWDLVRSEAAYKINFFIPKLTTVMNDCVKNINNKETEKAEKQLALLRDEFASLQQQTPKIKFEHANLLDINNFNAGAVEQIGYYLDDVKKYYNKRQQIAGNKKDEIYQALVDKLGKEEVIKLQQDFHNERLADIVQNKASIQKIDEINNRLLQKMDPIYMQPLSNYGRAHFYAPFKVIGSARIDTFWFNIGIIWLTSLVLYFTLLHDTLRKGLEFSQRFKIKMPKIAIGKQKHQD